MNDDITAFLPADTDTRRGLTVMEEEFVTYADAKVMLANTTYERAEADMDAIRALAALVIVGVLLFTSRSYFEVVIFLVVFSVAALLCAQLPAALAAGSGDVISISTAKELSALAENCVSDEWSKGKTIVLEADINLTGLDFEPVPLMNGTFDGQGHSIIGLRFDGAGSTQGLFRAVLKDGAVKNFSVSGSLNAPGYTGELTVRMRAPEGGRLYVLSDGAAVSHSFTRDGSYIVFALENGGSVIYAETERTEYLWPAIGGGAAVIAAAGAYLLFRRKKKRPAPPRKAESRPNKQNTAYDNAPPDEDPEGQSACQKSP